MNVLTRSDKIKVEILIFLGDQKKEITPSFISKSMGIKYETVKNALNFLEIIGLVEKNIVNYKIKSYEYFLLTHLGKKVFEGISYATGLFRKEKNKI